MGLYGNKNYQYDKNNNNYDYSGIKPSAYYEVTENQETLTNPLEDINQVNPQSVEIQNLYHDEYVVDYPDYRDSYVEGKEEFIQSYEENQNVFNSQSCENILGDINTINNINTISKEEDLNHLDLDSDNCYDDFSGYCDKCFKYKDIAGEKWQKSNELADAARKAGCQARKAEEKSDYYKKLAVEEYDKSKKYWDEYRNLSSESIELMRDARKCISKFEECLRECDLEDSKNGKTCFDQKNTKPSEFSESPKSNTRKENKVKSEYERSHQRR